MPCRGHVVPPGLAPCPGLRRKAPWRHLMSRQPGADLDPLLRSEPKEAQDLARHHVCHYGRYMWLHHLVVLAIWELTVVRKAIAIEKRYEFNCSP